MLVGNKLGRYDRVFEFFVLDWVVGGIYSDLMLLWMIMS